jgi:hypothetical protein
MVSIGHQPNCIIGNQDFVRFMGSEGLCTRLRDKLVDGKHCGTRRLIPRVVALVSWVDDFETLIQIY